MVNKLNEKIVKMKKSYQYRQPPRMSFKSEKTWYGFGEREREFEKAGHDDDEEEDEEEFMHEENSMR